jgi:hypothetical protein
MKNYIITLTEQQFQQFESIIGEMPTRFGNPLINLYGNSLTVQDIEDPKPIGGGGGGGAPKPKPGA